MNSILKRKAVVFLLSDFISPAQSDATERPLFQSLSGTNKRHDLNCITFLDPRELTLPDVGLITLKDAETGEHIELNTSSKKVRETYAANNTQRFESLKRGLTQRGIQHFSVRTDQPYIKDLRSFFEKRSAGRRGHH